MPNKKYSIILSETERKKLIKVVKNGTSSAKSILHANIILSLDESISKPQTFTQIALAFNTTTTTITTVKKEYCEKGIDDAINRKKRITPPVNPKITGEVEAKIIALSCSAPPAGRSKWFLRLLADKSVELQIIDSISHEAVSRLLKKRIKAPLI